MDTTNPNIMGIYKEEKLEDTLRDSNGNIVSEVEIQLSYYISMLIFELLDYTYNSKWQTPESVVKIAKYSNYLSDFCSKLSSSDIEKVSVSEVYNGLRSTLSLKFQYTDLPKQKPEDWTVYSLMDRDFIKRYVRAHAKTHEVMALFNKMC